VTARFAIYWAPPEDSTLERLGTAWLGRDAGGGEIAETPMLPGLDAHRWKKLTAAPRHYGLHATLKPPFILAEGRTEAQLCRALEDFAGNLTPFPVPPLRMAFLEGFIALVPSARSSALDDFASRCVTGFDAFRRPAPADELVRRRAAGLTDRQERNLLRWGYPYVLEDFRFHVTLTGRIEAAEAAGLLEDLSVIFADTTQASFDIGEVTLFAQESAGAPFHQLRRFELAGTSPADRSRRLSLA
jgi:putative phosphonate metabolism protein